jgi:hypothetical protein
MRMDCGGVRVSPLPQKEASYVSDGPRGIYPSAVHRQRELAVSSSLELVASFRVLRPATCLAVRPPHGERIPKRLPWGSSPSSRHQQAASTHARDTRPALRSVLGVSHALDGLLRHLPRGFVSPRSHVQGLPSRGLSLARSRTGFPRPVHALLALDAKSLRCDPRQLSRPRLQGFAPRGECGGDRELFRLPSAPRPSWALPPPGFPSTHRGNDFAFPPPTAFVRSEPAPTGPRRLYGAGRG